MAIPFVQYLRPSGRRVMDYIERPPEVETKAKLCIDEGYRFECEILGNGMVSLTSMYKMEESTVAIQISKNDEKIPASVDSLVNMTYEKMVERAH